MSEYVAELFVPSHDAAIDYVLAMEARWRLSGTRIISAERGSDWWVEGFHIVTSNGNKWFVWGENGRVMGEC
jgi:hypothetical protein